VIAVDTNLVVRLLTRDEEGQYQRARKVFREKQVFLPDTVLLETEWVLRFAYEFPRDMISAALENLCGLPNVRLANPQLLFMAIAWHKEGLDFADALHLAQCQPCTEFLTFDAKLVRKAKGFGTCKVKSP
jgi:predicted nucleic-acid-binding protein